MDILSEPKCVGCAEFVTGEKGLVSLEHSIGEISQKKELSALPVLGDHPLAQNRKQRKVNKPDSEMHSSAQSVL